MTSEEALRKRGGAARDSSAILKQIAFAAGPMRRPVRRLASSRAVQYLPAAVHIPKPTT